MSSVALSVLLPADCQDLHLPGGGQTSAPLTLTQTRRHRVSPDPKTFVGQTDENGVNMAGIRGVLEWKPTGVVLKVIPEG